jgi:hypothetical protein
LTGCAKDCQTNETLSGVYPVQRIRISFIEEVRRQPAVFNKRLEHFLKKTRQNKLFGTME